MFVLFVELLIDVINQFLILFLIFRELKATKQRIIEIKTSTLFNNYTYPILQNGKVYIFYDILYFVLIKYECDFVLLISYLIFFQF